MKIVMMIVGVLFSANAFGLGAFEAFDFNSAFQPEGVKLNEVCLEGKMFRVMNPKPKCVAYTKEVVDDTKYDLFPRYTKMCNAWEDVPSYLLKTTTYDCNEWELRDVDAGKGKSVKYRSVCIGWGEVEVPTTQRLDVYIKEIGQNLTSGQNMGSAMYTIPNCAPTGDLPDTDVPDTKK